MDGGRLFCKVLILLPLQPVAPAMIGSPARDTPAGRIEGIIHE
jgi:hypothetical protein